MSFNLLYLRKLHSLNSNPLKGSKLYERLSLESEQSRLGHIVRPAKAASDFGDDVVTFAELAELRPDLFSLRGAL